MRRIRLLSALSAIAVSLLVLAPSAMATAYSGEGIYGSTNDLTITETMFGLIAFFPIIIVLFSLLQSYLDHRKHARYDAAKRHATSADWRGGW